MARLWTRIDQRALLVTAVCIIVWRLLYQLPVVDVTGMFIERRLELYSGPGFFAAIGPNSIRFSAYSVGEEGITPYVFAIFLVNLTSAFSSRAWIMAGNPQGRAQLAVWTRGLALTLALAGAYAWTMLGQRLGALPTELDWSSRLFVSLQLAGGAAIAMMVADALDEFGLGFGYGPWLLYAMGYVAVELHRLAAYLAATPSVAALYKPLFIWALLTIGITAGAVAVLLAFRRVKIGDTTLDLRLLASGVFRPPQIAFAVVFFPSSVANYYVQANVQSAQWFAANWTLFGSSVWLDIAYGVIEGGLIAASAVALAAVDYWWLAAKPLMWPHVARLAVLGGVFLAVVTVLTPVVAYAIARSPEIPVPVSGFDIVFVTAVILAVVRAIEGYRPVVPYTATPLGIP